MDEVRLSVGGIEHPTFERPVGKFRIMFFADRRRRGPDRFFPWKVALFVSAAVLVFFGIRLERDWIIWLAIAVLLSAMALRFAPTRGRRE